MLSVLYPGLDLGKKFHEDHIFPKSRFTKKKLISAGVPSHQIDEFLEAYNLLPNLQLLAGTANIQKQDALPAEWIAAAFPTNSKRRSYLEENDLDDLPLGLADFLEFYQRRKARVRERLIVALGATATFQVEPNPDGERIEPPSAGPSDTVASSFTQAEQSGEPDVVEQSRGQIDPPTQSAHDLVRRFDAAMHGVYVRAKREAGYTATYFFEMLHELGGLGTARRLLAGSVVSDGFTALWERKRLDLTVENMVLQPEFRTLFTEDELDIARRRLAAYGFRPSA